MTFKLLLAIAALCLSGTAIAQTPDKYPSRPVTVIAPSGPGGGFDFVGHELHMLLARPAGLPPAQRVGLAVAGHGQ